MTPLAHRIAKELTLPVKRRSFTDKAGILQRITEAHCFDVSSVTDLARSLVEKLPQTTIDQDLLFLPAPITWIEHVACDGVRMGWLLRSRPNGEIEVRQAVDRGHDGSWGSFEHVAVLDYRGNQGDVGLQQRYVQSCLEIGWGPPFLIAYLALINTPRIIGRRQHMPHRGLERSLLASQQVVGKFPLHAWTEIALECTPPKDLSAQPGYEAHLTGRKCLHFCRAHLRIKNGRVEFVSHHWRGDSSLGIKRSRYKLQKEAAA